MAINPGATRENLRKLAIIARYGLGTFDTILAEALDAFTEAWEADVAHIRELEKERDAACQEAAFLRCHWYPPGNPIDGAENEGRHFPWEGDAGPKGG